MTFKNLLVHVDDDAGCPARLEAAIKLAQDHGAHLTSLYVQTYPSWPGYVRAQMPAEVMEIQERQLAEHAKGVEQRIVAAIEKSGLGADHRTRQGSEMAVAEIVALHARYADLAILGQDNPEEIVGRELPALRNVPWLVDADLRALDRVGKDVRECEELLGRSLIVESDCNATANVTEQQQVLFQEQVTWMER